MQNQIQHLQEASQTLNSIIDDIVNNKEQNVFTRASQAFRSNFSKVM